MAEKRRSFTLEQLELVAPELAAAAARHGVTTLSTEGLLAEALPGSGTIFGGEPDDDRPGEVGEVRADGFVRIDAEDGTSEWVNFHEPGAGDEDLRAGERVVLRRMNTPGNNKWAAFREARVSRNRQDELFEDSAFLDLVLNSPVRWVRGRHKGMTFSASHLEGDNEHLRGSYENHPEFGDIDSDMHQVVSLAEDVMLGHAQILGVDSAEAVDAADILLTALEGSRDEDDEEYEDEDDGSIGEMDEEEQLRLTYGEAHMGHYKEWGQQMQARFDSAMADSGGTLWGMSVVDLMADNFSDLSLGDIRASIAAQGGPMYAMMRRQQGVSDPLKYDTRRRQGLTEQLEPDDDDPRRLVELLVRKGWKRAGGPADSWTKKGWGFVSLQHHGRWEHSTGEEGAFVASGQGLDALKHHLNEPTGWMPERDTTSQYSPRFDDQMGFRGESMRRGRQLHTEIEAWGLNKLSQEAAFYRKVEDNPRSLRTTAMRCATCKFFQPDTKSCAMVDGKIAPDHVSALWEQDFVRMEAWLAEQGQDAEVLPHQGGPEDVDQSEAVLTTEEEDEVGVAGPAYGGGPRKAHGDLERGTCPQCGNYVSIRGRQGGKLKGSCGHVFSQAQWDSSAMEGRTTEAWAAGDVHPDSDDFEAAELGSLVMEGLKVVTWHGEAGTKFYVVRATGPNEEDWEVVETFPTREAAEDFLAGSRRMPRDGDYGVANSPADYPDERYIPGRFDSRQRGRPLQEGRLDRGEFFNLVDQGDGYVIELNTDPENTFVWFPEWANYVEFTVKGRVIDQPEIRNNNDYVNRVQPSGKAWLKAVGLSSEGDAWQEFSHALLGIRQRHVHSDRDHRQGDEYGDAGESPWGTLGESKSRLVVEALLAGGTVAEAIELSAHVVTEAQSPTFRQAQVELGTLGIVIRRVDGEFRVNFKGGSEDTAYYTNSMVDALQTGRAMAEEGRKGD